MLDTSRPAKNTVSEVLLDDIFTFKFKSVSQNNDCESRSFKQCDFGVSQLCTSIKPMVL